MRRGSVCVTAVGVVLSACGGAAPQGMEPGPQRPTRIVPGITVLVEDSLSLVAGKRIGLITNQAGVNEKGVSDIDILRHPPAKPQDKSKKGPPPPVPAPPKLVVLFSPEHGIRAAEDRPNVQSGVDPGSGLPIISLYGATTLPPPDSALNGLDALLIDLPDIGARPWTYPATMLYAMRAAAAHHLPVLVLDRPNPITGDYVEGPVLDSTVAYAGSQSPQHPARPTAIYPIPMRHGMTIGELARMYNDVLDLKADLHVIPVAGWRRSIWFDQTKLPWVNPSPNMPSLASAALYAGLVWLEATNVSVGRGTDAPFQRFGAPWMDAKRVAALLNERLMPGVKFKVEDFTPVHPTDEKYAGKHVHGVRVEVVNRNVLQTSRVGAAVLWALIAAHKDSLRIREQSFLLLYGVPGALNSFLSGEDPDAMIDREVPATVAFEQMSRRYWLYR
ncbi:MAG TPA: DUF1343 domain-containing protein [Gemmatimonadaceae bacterium]|nr:DUF1343 domain-containing protein [Gemmatimonadaceae bacterium]